MTTPIGSPSSIVGMLNMQEQSTANAKQGIKALLRKGKNTPPPDRLPTTLPTSLSRGRQLSERFIEARQPSRVKDN